MSNFIQYELIGLNLLEIPGCESLYVERKHVLSTRHLIIGVIYRNPQKNLAQFLEKLNQLLGKVTKSSIDICLTGNFNINLDPKKSQPM